MTGFPTSWPLLLALLAVLIFVRSGSGVYRKIALVFCTLVFAFGILLSANFIADYFTNRGIDESVLYHLEAGMKGAGIGQYRSIILAGFGLFVASLVLPIWLYYQRPAVRSTKSGASFAALLLMLFAIAGLPSTRYLFSYAAPVSTDLEFSDYYLPLDVNRELPVQRNVLILYLEGLEWTYFDKSMFPGLTPNLSKLFENWDVYTDIASQPFTQWTIAGLVASQCGLPLVTPSHGNSMSATHRFLPGAQCIGDLFSNNNYQLNYMGGADPEFAGKGKFLSDHGFGVVEGRQTLAMDLPDPGYQSSWGVYDDTLFSLALNRYRKLLAAERPFVLSLLTLDTHHPRGMPSGSCGGLSYQDGTNPSLNAVLCTDYLAAGFLNEILSLPESSQPLVVVMSDHLAMNNSATGTLDKLNRRLLLAIYDPRRAAHEVSDKPGTVFDIGPTILGYLGLDAAIGLGRNLLDSDSVSRLTTQFEEAVVAWRKELVDFWAFPSLSEGVMIDPDAQSLRVHNQYFRMPALIEFDEDLNSLFYFDSDTGDMHLTLRDHYATASLNRGLLWADRCSTIQSKSHANTDDYCLLLGRKGGLTPRTMVVEGRHLVSGEELRSLF